MNSPGNDYTYNGKELNEDFGLNLYDYGARWYDAALGRWWSVDIKLEDYQNLSPYSYVSNNPLKYIDFKGMSIINAHEEGRNAAQKKLEDTKREREEYQGNNKKKIKKLDKSVNKA